MQPERGEAVPAPPAPDWADLVRAFELFLVAPHALGGVLLRSAAGPQRDAVLAWLEPARLHRLPLHVTADRLLGGLSLAETLKAGRPVHERGVLAAADGGVVLVPMAERLEPLVTAQLCAALDHGELHVARDGLVAREPCRIGVVALDEGVDDERVPASLSDRLALQVDLTRTDPRALPDVAPHRQRVDSARAAFFRVQVPDAVVDALCGAAFALGVDSLRAVAKAAVVARVHAALCGRDLATPEDAAQAARWVLAPRATRLPSEPQPPAEPPPPQDSESGGDEEEPPDGQAPLGDVVLAAALSAMPRGLLDALKAGGAPPRSNARRQGRAGAARTGQLSGRPSGVRAGRPGDEGRVDILATLRAAAPWQTLRGRKSGGRIEVRPGDFQVRRVVQRTETCVVFVVDASGSAALQRLAEAKGAVERTLADCHARRDHVALVAFRGDSAALLLPPTRSLTRARRCLEGLAGGGATPLAAGISLGLQVALEARARGRTPAMVVMSDGRGNVALDGAAGSAMAMRDAQLTATAVRTAAVAALWLDTSPRPRESGEQLAAQLGATYLHLPYADAPSVAQQVRLTSHPSNPPSRE
ncbi:MAG: magnesium chelatase subunit D [Myxococcaceae bacterium]|nr:magnesium chelatase subunit D [Myxococcaceae bacterium]